MFHLASPSLINTETEDFVLHILLEKRNIDLDPSAQIEDFRTSTVTITPIFKSYFNLKIEI